MKKSRTGLIIVKIFGYLLLGLLFLLAAGGAACGCYLIASGKSYVFGVVIFVVAILGGEWVIKQAIDILKM